MKNIFLVLSVVFSFFAYLIAIKSIVKGKFYPQRVTRFLIFIISLIIFITLLIQKNYNVAWIALITLCGSFVIFLLSIRKGVGRVTKTNIFTLVMAIASLIVWKTTNNPILGLYMSILANIISFIPTIIKAWILPETEEYRFYLLFTFAAIANILSVYPIIFKQIVFPIYLFSINILIAVIIILKDKKRCNLIQDMVK